MKTEIWSILIAVGWLVISLYLKAKKKEKQTTIPKKEEWITSLPKSYEQEDTEEDEFEYHDFGNKSEFDLRKYSHSESLEGESLEHLSEEEYKRAVKPLTSSLVKNIVNNEVVTEESNKVEAKSFELRQAIIYQTILERKYT